MSGKVLATRPTLYERLPEVYRQRDEEQTPAHALRAFVGAIDTVFQALADRVGAQYDDLFIETCDDWVIAYLADLVGTSHLKGDAWTLRADVARTVKNRRRKGTLGAVESQVHALSGWAVHAVELRERLAWNQPLNHLRPDVGGGAPFGIDPYRDMTRPIRGGTASLRSPAWLSFVGTPFDPFARTVDVRPPLAQLDLPVGRDAPNLPNLGVFVWRLADFQTPVSRPSPPLAPWNQIETLPVLPGAARFAVRFCLHAQGEPLVLFNRHRYAADADPPNLASIDAVPGPMPMARLTTGTPAGRPEAYVKVVTNFNEPADEDPGLVLHLPNVPFAGQPWTFRGAELCAWEQGLTPPLRPFEIAVDAKHGRVVFGVGGASSAAFADPLAAGLRVSATTGAVAAKTLDGAVGAQPLPRRFDALPAAALRIIVDGTTTTLADALANLPARTQPLVIEIINSDTHTLDLSAVAGIGSVGGVFSLRMPVPQPSGDGSSRPWPLTIRARSGERPVIRLVQPLRIRPDTISSAAADLQALQNVRLQGLYITRGAGFPSGEALIAQAVVNRLELDGCTLDPGGARQLNGSVSGGRTPLRIAIHLTADRGLTAAQQLAFEQTPEIVLSHCIAGAIQIDRNHRLGLVASIVDAGAGVDTAAPALAIGAATGNAEIEWSAPLAFEGLTVLGRCRVEQARGDGAIFVHSLEVHDNQDSHVGPLFSTRDDHGDEADVLALLDKAGSCIRASWFANEKANRLPQHVACLFAPDARLRFMADRFGDPAYAQLALDADRRIHDEGPNADEMGAYGFLLATHRWKNVGIRLREFAPVGARVLLIPVS